MEYERMLNKEHEPSAQEILSIIGKTDLWLDLQCYLEQSQLSKKCHTLKNLYREL